MGFVTYGSTVTGAPVGGQLTTTGATPDGLDVAGGNGGGYWGIAVVDNGDGTYSLTGPTVIDNGDGTYSIATPPTVDNGDGTFTIIG